MADENGKTNKTCDSAITPGNDDNADRDAKEHIPASEIGGRDGPDPTRYGDWEKNGRCIDF